MTKENYRLGDGLKSSTFIYSGWHIEVNKERVIVKGNNKKVVIESGK